MTAKEILQAARDLIAFPDNWTTGVMARDTRGLVTPYDDPDALCFCALGALGRACSRKGFAGYDEARGLLPRNLVDINDMDGHAAVLAAFDKAIADA